MDRPSLPSARATPRRRCRPARLLAVVLLAVSAGCAYSPMWAQPPHAAGEPPQGYAQPAVDIISTALMLVGILIVREAAGSVASPDPDPPISPMRYWEDPDDWVVDCAGPYDCPAYQVMRCRGVPGQCRCACEYEGSPALAGVGW